MADLEAVSAAAARVARGAVADGTAPSAVWAVGDVQGSAGHGAAGRPDPDRPEPATEELRYDLASLTKIIAVWAVLGTLWDEGRFRIGDPLGAVLPDAAGHPLGGVAIRHLLAHTAGLPPYAEFEERYGTDPGRIRAGVLSAPLHRPPGTEVRYTDRAALILGYLAEHLGGAGLDALARERVWAPLGMDATRYGPVPAATAAPTGQDPDTGRLLRGTVHDPSARLLGGVSGIAGVFGPAADLGRFLASAAAPSAVPHPGRPAAAGAHRSFATGSPFSAAWVRASLTVQTGALAPPRGLLWHPAHGFAPGDGVWGHHGFTGTGMWVAPGTGRWAVLLTNKVLSTPDRGPIDQVRAGFCRAAFADSAPGGPPDPASPGR